MSDADTSKIYWEGGHRYYADQDWIKKPTVFATQVLNRLSKGTLLDLACGQGQDARFFVQNGFEVTGFDLSDEGLARAKNESEQAGLSIEFVQGDLSQPLPFEAEQFDAVYSHLGLHYFADATTRSLFREIHRVLKPGGRVASLFNTIHDPELEQSGFEELEPGFYASPEGIKKRYVSMEYLSSVVDRLFETEMLDENGSSHKDVTTQLVRYIGKK